MVTIRSRVEASSESYVRLLNEFGLRLGLRLGIGLGLGENALYHDLLGLGLGLDMLI